jgi:hypothetical protein
MRTQLAGIVVVVVLGSACAHVAPAVPRFVAVYEQRSASCTIHVMRDTRSTACFIAFRCWRQPVTVVAVEPTVCVP